MEPSSSTNEQLPQEIDTSIDPEVFETESSDCNLICRHKKLFLVLASSLLLALIIGGWWLLRSDNSDQDNQQSQQQSAESQMVIQSSLVEGNIEFSNDEDTWSKIAAGQEFGQGNHFRALNDGQSRGELSLDDDTTVRFSSGTEIEIIEVSQTRTVIRLVSGQVYARVTPSVEKTFSIHSSMMKATALGTAFMVSSTDGRDFLDVFEGTVKEEISSLSISQGKRLTVTGSSSDQQKIEDISIEVVKTDPFMLWNRQLDLEHSAFAAAMGILRDIESPELTLDKPVNGAQIEVVTDSEQSISFEGISEAGAEILITGDDGSTSRGVVDANGEFSVEVEAFDGSVDYTVRAIDDNGNTSAVEITVTYITLEPEESEEQGSISLAAILQSDQIVVNWAYDNLDASEGVVLTWARTGSDLSFVDSEMNVMRNEECPSAKFGAKRIEAGTNTSLCIPADEVSVPYSIRACRYDLLKDQCDVYSNEVTVIIPAIDD